jgi:hypothetical protein
MVGQFVVVEVVLPAQAIRYRPTIFESLQK